MSDTTYAFPASFAQQRLWFADRLVPGNPFYNLHTEIPIPSRVDRDAMARTLRTIVDRHETLRTSFDDEGGTPVQVVHPAVHLEVEFVDLHDLPAPARSAAVRTMSAEHAGRPFDLRRAPLLRTALLQLADDDFVLLITIHHIVSDGWSLGVLMREIQEIYGAYVQGRACPLEPLAIQYADFAIWQREWLQGAELETQLAYWRERLADLPALELPTDRRRPRLATFTGSSVSFRLPDGIREAATELGRTHGVTLFMFLLAGFTALLHRYTGQSDIVIGSPIANRTRAELEGLIGFFVNTLVLRTRLDGDPDVIELLARVKETTLGAYRHQDLPFDQLVEDLQPERDPSRNPLVQVVFQLHNAPTLAVADASAMAPDAQFSRGVSDPASPKSAWPLPHRLPHGSHSGGSRRGNLRRIPGETPPIHRPARRSVRGTNRTNRSLARAVAGCDLAACGVSWAARTFVVASLARYYNPKMPAQSFPRKLRLRSQAEFDRVYRAKLFAADDVLVINACASDFAYPRLGLSVSKKVGSAVTRNRWKRLIREAFRLSRAELPGGIDLVIRPQKGAKPDLAVIRSSLVTLARRIAKRLASRPLTSDL